MSSKTIGPPEEARTFSIVRLEPGARGPLVVAEPPPAVTVRPGDTFGKYEIVRLLRESGTGETFEAVHTDSRKSVAIKIMNPGRVRDSALESLLLRQAEALSRVEAPARHRGDGLRHAEGARVPGDGAAGGGGPRSGHRARARPVWIRPGPPTCCSRPAPGCRPATPAVSPTTTSSPRASCCAARRRSPPRPRCSTSGWPACSPPAATGSPAAGSGRATVFFLSPEQVRGEPGDVRSDEYALAVILYHCLTGRVPHQGDSSFAIMSSISSGTCFRRRVSCGPTCRRRWKRS